MNEAAGKSIGQYRIEKVLGDGGMGRVYKAYDPNLERVVALKVMHPNLARQGEFRERLAREARASARLNHPSIVQIFDFGETEQGLYIAMEYIEGGSLRAHLRRAQQQGRYLPLEQSIQIARQIAGALDYAHMQGVVHRDVKPANVILKRLDRPDRQGDQPFRAKLTDFGLVKLMEGSLLTQSGKTVGTPAYMSPEQCEGLQLDGRSDLYSLGVIIYELLTNHLPFEFNSLSEAMATHLKGQMPPQASEKRPDLPAVFDHVLNESLAKAADDRFANGAEMESALDAAMTSLQDLPTQVFQRDAPDEKSIGSGSWQLQTYRLRITTPGHDDRMSDLRRSTITIGRGSENDIVLPVEGVSRHHARLEATIDGWSVIDLGGINGTNLDSVRLVANKAHPLRSGSVLQIGPYDLTLERQAGRTDLSGSRPESRAWATLPDQAKIDADETEGERAKTASLKMFISKDRISINPGRRAEMRVEVLNQSDTDERVNVRVRGLPPEWVSVPDSFIRLKSNERVDIPIVFHPDRKPETSPGRQRFRVELISQGSTGTAPAANASLLIGAYESFEATLEPRQVRMPAVVRISLKNNGNVPSEFSIQSKDPGEAIQFSGERSRIKLKPNQSAAVDIRLDSRSKGLIGGVSRHNYEINVLGPSDTRKKLTGTAQASGLIPPAIAYGGFFLLIFACALATLLIVFRGDRDDVVSGSATAALSAIDLTATSQRIADEAVGLTAAAPLTNTLTVEGQDPDEDGLSNEQEALLDTDPDNPDSDGDGLLDGQEVLTWGSNPTKRDSDGDILLDSDEVLIYQTSPTLADTDGDGVPDGVEVALGTDPLDPADPPPTATATVPGLTETPEATASATQTATPTGTSSATPTVTATALQTATSTPSPTPSPTPSSTPSPTHTPTQAPSPTATGTPSPTATTMPNPAISCILGEPTLDGIMVANEWPLEPAVTFAPPGGVDETNEVFLAKRDGMLYVAYIVDDDTVDATTDSLRVYFDVNNNGGNPDESDRFFQVARDGTLTVRAGEGDNSDANNWDASYVSDNWKAQVGELVAGGWLVEFEIDLQLEMPEIAGDSPFRMMFFALFNGAQGAWPEGAATADADSWQVIDNIVCPAP